MVARIEQPEPMYTIAQARRFLGFETDEGVRKAIRARKLRAVRRGKRYVIPASAIAEYHRSLEPMDRRSVRRASVAVVPAAARATRKRLPHRQENDELLKDVQDWV